MNTNPYLDALQALLENQAHLNIVVVGANDGRFNDPIYEFAIEKRAQTQILLIEPNKFLLPYLEANYSQHPSHQIANCAIGEGGDLILYAVKQEWFSHFQPAYAKGWPPYRAATGITSANREHVQVALQRESLNPDEAIETLTVPCKQLAGLLAEIAWPLSIDVLQIDAEGYDDLVIHAASLQHTTPKLIYFENHNIPTDRLDLLQKHLTQLNYQVHQINGDSLAIHAQIDPLLS
jgi:FkbM family methyltransferase